MKISTAKTFSPKVPWEKHNQSGKKLEAINFSRLSAEQMNDRNDISLNSINNPLN